MEMNGFVYLWKMLNLLLTMKTKLLIMAMMIVGAMCSCT